MKRTPSHSIKLILMAFCFFVLSSSYGQNNKTTTKKAFGKTIKTSSTNPNNGKIRCVTTEYEQFLQEKNPNRMSQTQFETWLAPLVSKYKTTKANSRTAATIITIPVVVHVVHSGQAIGTAPNITDAQVQSQITVLNQDFRKMSSTPGYNTNPVGADVEIQFVLAQQDPNGNPTNGIDRVSFLQSSWSETDVETILKPATIWDSTMYLNMWSLKFTNNSTLGYAQFPDGSGLLGLNFSGGNATTDGVVSSFDVFGSNDLGSNFLLEPTLYNKGRTMTHEVGHWLGLKHIWGDGGSRTDNTKDCTASDYCEDTPQAGWENYDCDKPPYDSCPASPGNDMVENYMDYTNDVCMNIFTQNQKERIVVIMNNADRRKSLKTSTKGDAIQPLFANDSEVKILTFNSSIDYACTTPPPPTNKQVSIYNRGTALLTSVNLDYSINGGSNQNYTWTGSLTQNQSADITLPNTNFNGTLNVSITSTNGGTDQRTTNNYDTKNYFDLVPANYNYTDYVFRLQQDLWGSETTWNLKNSTGAIIDSGGPYSDTSTLPALITKNWLLPTNQCYTFTINDKSDDGICCGGGNGYYNITTNSGAITVKSGASFATTESITFTNNTLGTETFEAINEIYLYPNPTKGILNISVPTSLGLPTSLTISNSLGQIISRKVVSKETDLSLNTSSFSKGIYFITVTKDDQTKTLQFIKE